MELVDHRITPECRIQSKGDAAGWVRQQQFNTPRNAYECTALAAIIDAINKKDTDLALEIAYRRLTGVHLADLHNNWNLSSQIEWPYASSSMLSQPTLNNVVRHASSRARLLAKANSKSKDKQRFSKQQKNFNFKTKSKSGVGSSKTGASHE